GHEPALRGRGGDLRRLRRGRRDDRGREVLRPRLRYQPGGDIDVDGDGEGPYGDRGRDTAEGRAARGDRRPAPEQPDPPQVRAARADHAQGRAAQGQGNTAPRGPVRLRRARAEIAELAVAHLAVCPGGELPRGRTKIVRAGELAVCVYNIDGELYAIEDRCSHDDGPLCEGDWDPDEGVVICPRHGANFDIRTGDALTLPA